MSVTPPPGRRPDLTAAVGNHEARLRALERITSGACYQRLTSAIAFDDGDPLSLQDITQNFDHLVIEGSFAYPTEGPSYLDALQDISIITNGDDNGGGGPAWGWSSVTYDGDRGQANQNLEDEYHVVAKGIVPSSSPVDDARAYCQFTAKLDWYSLTDRAKAITWQAASIQNGDYAVTQVGSGLSIYSGGDDPESSLPITRIDFYLNGRPGDLDADPWAAGSRVTVYGIC